MSDEKKTKPVFELIPLGQTPVRFTLELPHPVTGEMCEVAIEGKAMETAELAYLDGYYQGDPNALSGASETEARRVKLTKVITKIEGVGGTDDVQAILSHSASGDLVYRMWPAYRGALVTGEGFRNAVAARKPDDSVGADGRVSMEAGAGG